MKEDTYSKDYRAREYDRFSDLDPQKPKKKFSFLTILLIGLIVLFVCSLGYDNIIKPYLAKRAQQTENPVLSSPQESKASDDSSISLGSRSTHSSTQREEICGGYSEKEVQEIVNGSWDKETSDIEEETTEKVEVEKKDPVKKQVKREKQIEEKPNTELSTSELLERHSHNMMVREAKRMGVSTEGTTSEIMDRISHANMVREAKRMGVSTEGTTSEIMDRITRKQMENLDW